jgi:PKHD-type hydroxylase
MHCIAGVLTEAEVARLAAVLDEGELEDGQATAGWHARLVKRNRQLRAGPSSGAERERVRSALAANEVFAAAALPRRFAPVLLVRYESGMAYGPHVDDALMGADAGLRSDLAVTVFLSAAEDYEGGELILDTPAGEQAVKLPAGAAVVYPATTLHRVEPVRAGVRKAAVTWVESHVRRADQREVLFDLERLRRAVFERDGKSAEFDLLAKTYANLLRMWAGA